jgi:tRNA (cmo5U34)-methyltransferase
MTGTILSPERGQRMSTAAAQTAAAKAPLRDLPEASGAGARRQDRIFGEKRGDVADFAFGADVAAVFDDMLQRSVPFYGEIQRMIVEMSADFAIPGTRVMDLGCSTGTTLAALDPVLPGDVRFVGVDNSEEMLGKARDQLAGLAEGRALDLRLADLNEGVVFDNASIALLVLTLQFIRPLRRERLISDVYRGLNDRGALIIVEKVLGEDSMFNRLFIKYYYEMKRRHGYSDLEIAQKREALENVLVPYKLLENRELLLNMGFEYVDVFFKWYNFCGLVAVK